MVTINGINRDGVSSAEFAAMDPRITEAQKKVLRNTKERVKSVHLIDGILLIETEAPKTISCRIEGRT